MGGKLLGEKFADFKAEISTKKNFIWKKNN